jgi:hypothetical protein
MVGLRFKALRLCSVPPFLYWNRETVAAPRMLIVYAGSLTIRCGAAGKSSSFPTHHRRGAGRAAAAAARPALTHNFPPFQGNPC